VASSARVGRRGRYRDPDIEDLHTLFVEVWVDVGEWRESGMDV
jgi:hypothetical protein